MLTRKGRHDGITTFISAQRANQIPKNIRTQCKIKYAFLTIDEVDRDAIQKESPIQEFEGKPLKEAVLKLKTLEGYEIDTINMTLKKFKITP